MKIRFWLVRTQGFCTCLLYTSFGGTSGIVSLEDLVEEIFGDIEDEHDNTSYISKQIDEREYVSVSYTHLDYSLQQWSKAKFGVNTSDDAVREDFDETYTYCDRHKDVYKRQNLFQTLTTAQCQQEDSDESQ